MKSITTPGNVSRETSITGKGRPNVTSIEAIGNRILAGFEPHKCEICQIEFNRRKGSRFRFCQDCNDATKTEERIKVEAEEVIANAPVWVMRSLSDAGISRRELHANLHMIEGSTHRILMGMEELQVKELLSGQRVDRGFGLSAGVGRGKTFALAAIFKTMVLKHWIRHAPKKGRAVMRHFFGWVSWPEFVNRLRITSMANGGIVECGQMVKEICDLDMLVIDDLGVERIRGASEDDWAMSQLDAVVDARYNDMRPTWYTTNLNETEFRDRYGPRIWSRLCLENTWVVLEAGRDMRMRS